MSIPLFLKKLGENLDKNSAATEAPSYYIKLKKSKLSVFVCLTFSQRVLFQCLILSFSPKIQLLISNLLIHESLLKEYKSC